MKRMTSKSRLGLQQKLLTKLSPQQIQLMKLLQLPVSALEERIQAELEANPALEEGRDEGALEWGDLGDLGDSTDEGGEGDAGAERRCAPTFTLRGLDPRILFGAAEKGCPGQAGAR